MLSDNIWRSRAVCIARINQLINAQFSQGRLMNLKRARNPYIYASATVLGLLLVGWLFGQLMATSDNTYKRLLLLQDVVNQVSLRYVDNIPSDNLYHRAVEGLLDGLDYHEVPDIAAADFILNTGLFDDENETAADYETHIQESHD